jgi:serine/threonine-protein kinase RsbW
VLRATLGEVTRATLALGAMLPSRLPAYQRYAIEIGLAEILTNVVKHGRIGEAPGSIRITWREREDRIEFVICDTGRAIPAERLAEADDTTFDYETTDISSLPESGMGLALIKASFDVVEYRSRSGFNRMLLQKIYS